ncbi:hypothetical protein MRB53_018118 [Persea americana]|uniref:Uncharacterized protein n=1 Tax=Persea americana TaxID=3435 RepID=A0ACC2M6W7_PERAE|nr:hypothetical protein MRB53_018118 [Persea americana]
MASSVNNIAATFATVAISSSSSSSSTPATTPPSTPSSINPITFSHPITPQPISASWNPQTTLHRSQRSSLLRLYGPPGPKPFPQISTVHPSPIIRRSKTISVGDRLPNATLAYLDRNDNLVTINVSDLTRQKKVVLVAVPGAFVPVTGSKGYVTGFLQKAEEMKMKGVGVVACVSVNDVHVMKAWGERLGVGERMMMLSDGSGDFARAMGVSVDLGGTSEGFGIRSKRYSLVAVNGVVKSFLLERGDVDDILNLL